MEDFEKLPFYWDCKKEEWVLDSGEKFDDKHSVVIGGMINGVSCDYDPFLVLINLRVNVKGKYEFFCVYVRKDMLDLSQVKDGDGCVCDIFPMHSAFFFAKSIKIIPRHVCLAVGAGLNEVLS